MGGVFYCGNLKNVRNRGLGDGFEGYFYHIVGSKESCVISWHE